MQDEWGGIDKKIEKTVMALNKRGIRTTGSCEGHADHGSPSPWISISARPEIDTEGVLERENRELQKSVQALLDQFYKGRNVSEDKKIVIRNGKHSFWIHNGGKLFDAWRAHVEEIVEKNKRGEEITSSLPQLGIANYQAQLEAYQKEFEDFGDSILLTSTHSDDEESD